MSPGKLTPSNGHWLSRRHEYSKEHKEWEEFRRNNEAIVPNLVGPVDSLREIMLKAKVRGQAKAPPITEGLTVDDHVIATEPGVEITVRAYVPYPRTDGQHVMLYFHGGGWALGDLEGEDRTCRALCVNVGVVVVSVNYRLAPEYPYPAALNDAWAALEWVHNNPAELPVVTSKLFVGGTSAGANLAAVICHHARTRGITIHGQFLRIPVLCQSAPHYRELGLESMDTFHNTPILCRQSMIQFLNWYHPPDAADISVSPLLAANFTGLPPAYIQICGNDPLRDEALAYADRLEESGIPVKVNVYHGLPHAFWIFPEISTTGEAMRPLIDGLNWLVR